jgi:hypothetical protein
MAATPPIRTSGMEAKPLKKESDLQASTSNERSAYLLSQRAALMPQKNRTLKSMP